MQLPAEERRICAACIERQSSAMAAWIQGPAGLVESDVSIAADTDQQQIEASQRRQFELESRAFRLVIAGSAVQEVHVSTWEVDAVEQVMLHEGAIASLAVRCEPNELVDVERVRAREIRFARFMKPRELIVDRERGSSRRQSEHRRGLASELCGDGTGRRMGGFVGRPEHTNVHIMLAR